ncbi:MAG: hypothetical protein KA401_04425 [Anaerolineae bacterium]|nr:hypothetical protein [Chloroflexota bacterium]MBP6298570.1 hypothetical protein [Anaerolineae bacterium]
MTKRRYNFLRLVALLMIVLGLLGALAGIGLGVVMIVRPSLLLGELATADLRNSYALTGAVVIVGSLLGGLIMAAVGQLYQVFLELLEVNRLQVKGLKAMVDRN